MVSHDESIFWAMQKGLFLGHGGHMKMLDIQESLRTKLMIFSVQI